MIAADTNILVRLLTADDPVQTTQARELFEREVVFVPKSVLLETEWVVRVLYKQNTSAVVHALRLLTSLAQVRCEDEPAVTRALNWADAGMDFADALHLASCQTQRFLTFDRALIRRARRLRTEPEATAVAASR